MSHSEPNPAKAAAMLSAAIAAGTHSPTCSFVCQGCRRWVGAIFHVTLDHKRFCFDCAPESDKAKARKAHA